MAKTKSAATQRQSLEEILGVIIDEWYERVEGHYITDDQEIVAGRPVELKRFHDDNGHRIKFDKENLDITYGLHTTEKDGQLTIEISVNNKVENFDYEMFESHLIKHYTSMGAKKIKGHSKLRSITHDDLFQLESGISDAFSVERRPEKADIMRLVFSINPEHQDALIANAKATRKLIERHCVAPFRSIYAAVYRGTAG